jgi:hypothetical protein
LWLSRFTFEDIDLGTHRLCACIDTSVFRAREYGSWAHDNLLATLNQPTPLGEPALFLSPTSRHLTLTRQLLASKRRLQSSYSHPDAALQRDATTVQMVRSSLVTEPFGCNPPRPLRAFSLRRLRASRSCTKPDMLTACCKEHTDAWSPGTLAHFQS